MGFREINSRQEMELQRALAASMQTAAAEVRFSRLALLTPGSASGVVVGLDIVHGICFGLCARPSLGYLSIPIS